MTLSFDIAIEPEDASILVLPYDPDLDGQRTNRGFEDLRGKPERAARVCEAERSPALKALLVALAEPSSAWFSIGCDTATFAPDREPKQLSGYLQIAASDLMGAAPDLARHLKLGASLKSRLRTAVADDDWSVRVILARINPADLGGPSLTWSAVVEFAAFHDEDPIPSAERLIAAIGSVLTLGE